MSSLTTKLKRWAAGFFIASMTLASSGQTITYFHNDVAGSPLVATDAAGNVIWKENYKPYGEKLNNHAVSDENKIGYAGRPFDDNTGLSYMGSRYYDPMLGRFMGVDPIGFREDNIHSLNRYAYANNDPYKYVDPDGRDAINNWQIAEKAAAEAMRKGGWAVEEGVEVILKGLPGELDTRGIADFIARKDGNLVIGEVKDGKGAKLRAFQKAMFGEAGALERLAIKSADRAASLGLTAGETLVSQLNTSAKVAYTLTGELGGRAAGEAARRTGGQLATRIAFGTLKVLGGVPVLLLTHPGNN